MTPADAQRLLRRYEAAAHPDLFFIGSADRRITFYAQQVRALELIHALHVRGRLQPDDRVAVVGGGGAGLMAAAALGALGTRVEVLEASNRKLHRQAGSQRLLDPRIYDWPDLGALNRDANLPFLTWERETANAASIGLSAAFAALPIECIMRPNAPVVAVDWATDRWEVTVGNGPPEAFTKVIIAAGFGDERGCGVAEAQDYWARTGPPEPATQNARCLISGIGDGGLTDMLTLAIRDFDHRSFTEQFLSSARARDLSEAVDRAESAAKQAGDRDLTPHYDAHVEPVLQAWGVTAYLRPKLHGDRSLVVNAERGSLIERGAAARLNQVMAYAVSKAMTAVGPARFQLAAGRLQTVEACAGGRKRAVGIGLVGGGHLEDFDLVIVRHGPRRDAHLAWLAGKYEAFQAHRTQLATTDPEAEAPPRLTGATYDFFERAMSDRMPAPFPAQNATAREMRSKQIVIEADPATGHVAERGSVSLRDAINNDLSGLEVHVRGEAPTFGEFGIALARAVRSTSGRVTLTTPPAALAGWRQLWEAVGPRAAPAPGPFAPVLAPTAGELSALIDSLLLSKLDLALQEFWEAGVCPQMGEVHATIRAEMQPRWLEWQESLSANPRLLSEVLGLLWNLDPEPHPWDGSCDCLARLSGALVLMLASSLAMPELQPASTGRRANLALDGGAALGSGSESIGGRAIDECNNPNSWDADMLILSTARELAFIEGGDLILDAGVAFSPSLGRPQRVAPALIKNSLQWRGRLQQPLNAWVDNVRAEWESFGTRQKTAMEGLR